MSTRLLLVEDDESLGYIIKEYLDMNDLKTDWVKDGLTGFKKIKNNSYDLCILDIMMPEKDGFTLAKEINELENNIPFVFLTAKSLKVDKLKGFGLGADDYIEKPIDEEIFIARIKAILNRSRLGEKNNGKYYSIGRFRFDPDMRELKSDKENKTLSPREADVLALLCKNKGRIVRRETALKKIWGESTNLNRRIMDVYISKLRGYLDVDSTNIEIKNIHGTGFVLND